MAEKKGGKTPKPATKTTPFKKVTGAKVKGGMKAAGPESCAETGDSGMMGCGTG